MHTIRTAVLANPAHCETRGHACRDECGDRLHAYVQMLIGSRRCALVQLPRAPRAGAMKLGERYALWCCARLTFRVIEGSGCRAGYQLPSSRLMREPRASGTLQLIVWITGGVQEPSSTCGAGS